MPEITQEELELFNKYRALGTLESVTSSLVAAQEAELEAVATRAGFKPKTFRKLFQSLPEGYSIVRDDLGNESVKTPKGEMSLQKFAESEWEEFLPSLKVEETEDKSAAAPKVTQFVRQPSERQGGGQSLVAKTVRQYIDNKWGSPATNKATA